MDAEFFRSIRILSWTLAGLITVTAGLFIVKGAAAHTILALGFAVYQIWLGMKRLNRF